jgi:hypothetical protein
MRKPKILMIMIACLIAISLAPATASAVQAPTSNDSSASLEAASTASELTTLAKAEENPKLNLKKVTIPVNKPNGNGWMVLTIKGTSKKATWSTSDESIVSFDKYKQENKISLTGMKKGKATITAKVGDTTLKCKVTVTKPKSEKALMKKIKVDTSTVDKQYITFENTSKYYLKATGRIRLYDKAGNQVDWSDTYIYLAPGKSQKVYVSNLYGYSKCKFEMQATSLDNFYHKLGVKATVKPVQDNYLPVELKNTSKYAEYPYVTVFFKKDGEIVWTEQQQTKEELKPGKSATVSIYLYNGIPEYDSVSAMVTRA